MRYPALVLILTLLLLVGTVSAGDPVIIGNKGAPVLDEKSLKVAVTYIPFTKSLITTILEIIGLESKETVKEEIESSIDVFISDEKIATIPQGSKFAAMEIHEICLPYQYGTDNWYNCERSL